MKKVSPFQKKALDYKSNILLSANAGSGKTFVLSKRFIEILVNENIGIENIVAITFTDKAAGELNKKIANEIEERIKTESNYSTVNKLENLRRQLVSANISTIHSFCVAILREFAPEANIDANFIPIDQNTSDDLIELSIDETINLLLSDDKNSESIKYLIRVLGSKNSLVNSLTNSIAQRKIFEQHLIDLYKQENNSLRMFFENIVEQYLEKLFRSQLSSIIKNIRLINGAVLKEYSDNEIANNVAVQLVELEYDTKISSQLKLIGKISNLILTQKYEVRNRNYLSKKRDRYENEIQVIENFFYDTKSILEADFSANATNEIIRFGKCFVELYEKVNSIYLAKKNHHGYLDYEDLLLFTLKIIELDDVRKYLANKFKYIMIDEYQDTNELQYKIFMPILDNLRTGNLFVVGDDKQSIYMFNDAELEIFNRTRDDINNEAIGGKVLNLPHSYRMAPELALFINNLFSRLFDKPKEIFNEVTYSELICAADESQKGKVEFLLADEEIPEAENVANKILELIETGDVRFSDIGILCLKRNYFLELENEFSRKNIPFVVVGGKGFYQRKSIYDLYNYCSFLINTKNDTALVGILRSPFYTISDKELFLISLEEGDSFFDKVKKYFERKGTTDIVKMLERHVGIAQSSEIFSLLRAILVDTGYWAVAASKKNSTQEIANLEKLIAIAREYSSKSFKNLYDFTVYLRESIELTEDEGQAQISEEKNAVNLLTIHKAKGLEYKCVIIYKCNNSLVSDSVKAKSVSFDKTFGVLTKVYINKDYFSPPVTPAIVSLYNYTHQKKRSAEFKRLLYVAVTRAMKYLFISASINSNKNFRESFLQLFSYGLNSDFSNDVIDINGKIKMMTLKNEKFIFSEKEISTQVNVYKKVEHRNAFESLEKSETKEKQFLIERIDDIAKKEIISATKISMYNQCPVKYQLTYELGFLSLRDLIREEKENYEFSYKEDEIKAFSAVKGKIIHAILKDQVHQNMFEEVVNKLVDNEDFNQKSNVDKLKQNIISDLVNYYKSDIFKKLNESRSYKNEFEVYCEEGDYYLYGIIDKLIYDKDKLTIIDYKTDNVKSDELKERAESYFTQLTFYAYILSKLYANIDTFEIRPIFIKYPDVLISKIITRVDLSLFQKKIYSDIINIHSNIFIKNLKHCSQCHFTIEGDKCVIE